MTSEDLEALLAKVGGVPAVAAVVAFTAGAMVCGFLMFVYSMATKKHKHDVDLPFKNGLSYSFPLRIMTEGASYGTLIRALCERVRGRAFISYKKWIFFGDEMWWVAHPAITAHVFSPVSSKNWFKVNKTQANDAFYMKESAEGKRTALLYTGDDQRWRTARYHLTPYFYNTDFTTLDDKVCAIVKKHIDRLVVEGGGHTELLEFLLLITIDLLCQVLYDSVLSQEDLGVLTHCMAEYIVPGTKYRGDYDGLDCLQYHTKVAVQMTKGAGAGTLAGIIRDCPDMTDKLKEENVAFFLEALTPAFASFWTISNILLITDEKLSDKAKTDATFRQQCIKESLRMYPPVPVLWPREAKCDHTMPNPIYAEGRPKAKRSFLSKMFGSVPFEEQPELKVKKGTKVFVIPTVYHYDDRFWFLPNEFRPERWNKDPGILGDFGENASSAKLNIRKRQSQHPGLLGNMKDTLGSARSMKTMQGKAKEFFADETLRSLIIGKETEEIQAAATYDQILESTDESAADLQKWTFLPFGLGQHTCMGRRLAVAMVDNTVKTFLKNDVMFYKGVVPSLFSRKIWHERVEAVAAVYNFPADPVFVQMKPSSKMKSVYSQSFYHGGK